MLFVCHHEEDMEIKPKKENRRVAMTKRMLKDSLVELLKQKDIYHITIRELCLNADINRTTFYKYYSSQFELLNEMEDDIINVISTTINQNIRHFEQIVVLICKYFEDNLDFMRMLINNNIDNKFAQKMLSIDIVKYAFYKEAADMFTPSEIEYLYEFMQYGSFQMICHWLNKDNRESPQVLARLMKRIATRNWLLE